MGPRIRSAHRSAGLVGRVLACFLCLAAGASAQTDAGAPVEPETRNPAAAATDPSNLEGTRTLNAEGAAGQPGVAQNANGFPKALGPQHRLPENLQGWMRERNRRNPTLAERRPTAPSLPPQLPADSEQVDVYKRRLRSFDEGGVTVLSNRHATPPPAPPPVAATAAVAVRAPAPPVEEEPELDAPSSTETRSLRAQPPNAKSVAQEPGLGWPAFAVPVAAIGLALIWLRRRRQAGL